MADAPRPLGSDMDWDNARVFLAIYRNGTLRRRGRAAADRPGHSGPAPGRAGTVAGRALSLRTPAGYVPTAAGELAFAAAERMEQAADQLQRQMQGLDHRLSGVVRMASSEAIGSYCDGRGQAPACAAPGHHDIAVDLDQAEQPDAARSRSGDPQRPARQSRPDPSSSRASDTGCMPRRPICASAANLSRARPSPGTRW